MVIIKELGNLRGEGTDLKGASVFAGLIDIHSHGCMGYDTMDGDKLNEMSVYLAQNGVTSWLPTTMTMDMETLYAGRKLLGQVSRQHTET